MRLDGRLLHRAVLPVCRLRRGDLDRRPARAPLRFTFRGGRVFAGEYRTTRADTIEADVWQAGADPTAVILGLSFSPRRPTPARSRVLLNTVHVLAPDGARESALDVGLTVRTYPVASRPALGAVPGIRRVARGAA